MVELVEDRLYLMEAKMEAKTRLKTGTGDATPLAMNNDDGMDAIDLDSSFVPASDECLSAEVLIDQWWL